MIGSPGARRLAGARCAFLALAVIAISTTTSIGPSAATGASHIWDPALSLGGFSNPCGAVTDAHGNIYVASYGGGAEGGGRISVFSPGGAPLKTLTEPDRPCGLAIDSSGDLYVVEEVGADGRAVYRYTPDSFPPTPATNWGPRQLFYDGRTSGVAVDPSNDHVFVAGVTDGAIELKPDGSVEGVDEVQQVDVDATGGSFDLTLFPNGSADLRYPESFTAIGAGALTAGSPTISSLVTASGLGTLAVGSSEVRSVDVNVGQFEVGQPISGPGIPVGTEITEVTRGVEETFIRMSNLATTSGVDAPISSRGPGRFGVGATILGPGIPPGTIVQSVASGTITLSANATRSAAGVPLVAGIGKQMLRTGGTGAGDLTAGSPTVGSLASAEGTGDLVVGSSIVSSVSTSTGEFRVGQIITGAGIPPGTAIAELQFGGDLLLSNPASASVPDSALTARDPFAPGQEITGPGIPVGTEIQSVAPGTLTLTANATASVIDASLSASLAHDATAAKVQASLAALPLIDPGNVSVGGGPGGSASYSVAFTGDLAHLNVMQFGADASGLTGGGSIVTATTAADGYDGRFGPTSIGIDVRGANGDIALIQPVPSSIAAKIVLLDGGDRHLEVDIDGSETLPGELIGFTSSIAFDQDSGELFFNDVHDHGVVDQFDSTGSYLRCIGERVGCLSPPAFQPNNFGTDIAVDNGALSPNQGYLFVTSGLSSGGNLFAFAPAPPGPECPKVSATSVSEATDTQAVLEAKVNPKSQPTTYYFEYVEDARFQEDGYAQADRVPIPEGNAGAGSGAVQVSEPVGGLAPATNYHFRVVATNETCATEGEAGQDRTFTTFPARASSEGRAYELVTPPETNGRLPTAWPFGQNNASIFEFDPAGLGGDSLVFGIEGGSLPGFEGNGFYESYRATRSGDGWSSEITAPSGAQAAEPNAGGVSADHRYSLWRAVGENGSLAVGTLAGAHYLRHPDGAFEPVGVGSEGEDPAAVAKLVTAAASHVIFVTGQGPGVTAVKLEDDAPPTGTAAIYDRSPGSATRVVSLLPGGLTPSAGQDATFLGASADGTAVAFEIDGTVYLRRDNAATLTVTPGDASFGGISDDGERVFYVEGGDVFAFDAESEASLPVGSGGESTLVNVSADGSHAYFVSPQQLDGGKGAAGENNLYVWGGGAPSFIATVTELDVVGLEDPSRSPVGGLGLWVSDAVSAAKGTGVGAANVTARTTPDGQVLVFESRANLTGYDSDGRIEVYRYDAAGPQLSCVSCSPIGAEAESDARLESHHALDLDPFAPVNAVTSIANVSDDGGRVFFQSGDRLAADDVDGLVDVYEWRAQGVGGCDRGDGCLNLVSSGRSTQDDYLYAMTPDGANVFFWTTDVLLPADTSGAPSIYDARIGGGFDEGTPYQPPCSGDACQGASGPPPPPPLIASTVRQSGRLGSCPRGKRKARVRGKVRCVPRKRHRGGKAHGRKGTRR